MNKIILILLLITLSISRRSSGGGTYAYYNHQGRAEYVGATNNFNRRHQEHVRDQRHFTSENHYLVREHMTSYNSHDAAYREKQLIGELQPSANKNRGGCGLYFIY